MVDEKMNPLSEFLTDEIYESLSELNLIDKTAERNYKIRKKFKSLRADKIRVESAIGFLEEEYYLSYDTIKKIAYKAKP